MRILFVDDYNRRPREIINYLELNGMYNEAKIVANKEEAFLLMTEEQFDLVMLDIKLPDRASSEIGRASCRERV